MDIISPGANYGSGATALLYSCYLEIAAVRAVTNGLGASPNQPGVHIAVGSVIGITEGLDDLCTGVAFACLKIRAADDIETGLVFRVFWETVDEGTRCGLFLPYHPSRRNRHTARQGRAFFLAVFSFSFTR